MLKLHFEFWVKTFIHICFPFSHPGGNQNYFLRIWENVNARVWRATFFSLMCALHFELSTFFFPFYHTIQKTGMNDCIFKFFASIKEVISESLRWKFQKHIKFNQEFVGNDSNTSVENNRFFSSFSLLRLLLPTLTFTLSLVCAC